MNELNSNPTYSLIHLRVNLHKLSFPLPIQLHARQIINQFPLFLLQGKCKKCLSLNHVPAHEGSKAFCNPERKELLYALLISDSMRFFFFFDYSSCSMWKLHWAVKFFPHDTFSKKFLIHPERENMFRYFLNLTQNNKISAENQLEFHLIPK